MALSSVPRRSGKKVPEPAQAPSRRQEEHPTLLRHRGPRRPELVTEPEACSPEPEAEAGAAYAHGDLVECFSAEQQRWLTGVVAVIVQDGPQGCPPSITYEVSLGARRLLQNVKLDALREPLRVDEAVEVFDQHGGVWLPALMVAAHQTRGPSPSLSYQVRLEVAGAPHEISGVRPELLRRHFTEGLAVDVYRGAGRGWAPAVVCQQAGVQVDDAAVGGMAVCLCGRSHGRVEPGLQSKEFAPRHLLRPRRQC